jgi:hypothetical protein
MRIIRGQPATGKPPMIVCDGCGKRAPEAGIAVSASTPVRGYGPDGPVMAIEDDESAQRLCEQCVTALERAESR